LEAQYASSRTHRGTSPFHLGERDVQRTVIEERYKEAADLEAVTTLALRAMEETGCPSTPILTYTGISASSNISLELPVLKQNVTMKMIMWLQQFRSGYLRWLCQGPPQPI
jgi:hypothetical protein